MYNDRWRLVFAIEMPEFDFYKDNHVLIKFFFK